MILRAFCRDTNSAAKATARDLITEALDDCETLEDRHAALVAHIAIAAGLLAHEVGERAAAQAVRGVLHAVEGMNA